MEEEDGSGAPKGAFVSWPEIKKFSTMLLHVEEGAKFNDAEAIAVVSKEDGIEYKGKIKLHGTNSGVTVIENEAVPQSRTRSLVGCDNEGFGKWVRSPECVPYFSKHLVALKNKLGARKVVLFGEWCGSGIMKGAAICKVPQRHFCIFGLAIDDALIIEPSVIEDFIIHFKPLEDNEKGVEEKEDKQGEGRAAACASVPSNLIVLPWLTEGFTLNFKHNESLNEEIAKMNKLVEDVDTEDPWVKKTFSISGPGEGIVWYPVGLMQEGGKVTMSLYSMLVFKAKGEKHLVVKQKQPIQRHLEIPEGVDGFIEMFATVGRFEQGVREACGDKFDKRLIGKFVNWVTADVEKESKAELEKSGLNFAQIKGKLLEKAKAWYINQVPNVNLDK